MARLERADVVTHGWHDYALIDSGEHRKLERFGSVILDRPDTQALWAKSNNALWNDAHAQFVWAEKGERWSSTKDVPESWSLMYKNMQLTLSMKGFKHIGVFPEHCTQWDLLEKIGLSTPGLRMLNLFGYTGAASIASAQAGMRVTHVDASKATIANVHDNALHSSLPTDAIHTVTEDAYKYAKRLVQRGETYDVIVMDPPAFGRGPKGEVWKIEEKLGELLALIPSLLTPNAQCVMLNGYAAGYSARTFAELLRDVVPAGVVSYGDIGIKQLESERVLTTGIYTTWRP